MNPAAPTAAPGLLAPEVDAINQLLRAEVAAAEAYEQACTHLQDLSFAGDLRTIRYAHERAADALRNHVRNLGGEPAEDTSPAVQLHSPAAAAGRPDAILSNLRQTEERGVAAYEQLLQREQMPDECRYAIRVELLARCHEHIDTLAGMAAAVANKG